MMKQMMELGKPEFGEQNGTKVLYTMEFSIILNDQRDLQIIREILLLIFTWES